MVELHHAYVWTCEDCGRDSFTRAITLAPGAIDLDADIEWLRPVEGDAIREWVEGGGAGDWLMAPTHVECAHCGAKFEAEVH